MENKTHTTEQESSVKRSVIERIETGKACMRPRWYFVLMAGLTVTGIVVLLVALLFLVSFAIFALKESGLLYVPAFGVAGLSVFIRSLPLVLLLLVIVCIVLVERLVRHYEFAYSRPIIFSLAAITILVGAGAVIAAPWHVSLSKVVRERHLMIGERFYRDLAPRPVAHVYRGTVVGFDERGFVILHESGATSSIVITELTKLPFGKEFRVGDRVVIFSRDDGKPGDDQRIMLRAAGAHVQ